MTPADNTEGSAERSVSQRKLDANRANAQKSTGPRTKEGKRLVARNAIRHGILAREVVIGEGDGAEREEDYADVCAGLYAAHAPRDAAEQLEVENLAAAYWMLRRAYRATTGDTRTGLDTVRRDWEEGRRRRFEALLVTAVLDHGAELRESSLGCAHLLRLLDDLTAAVTTRQISHTLLDPLLKYFPPAMSAPISVRMAGEAELSLDEEGRRELAALVTAERVALERAHAEAERHEQEGLSAETARLALPANDAAVRDLRYVTAFRRDIARVYKTLAMLKQRSIMEPQDADAVGRESDGEANEPGHRA
jgi:hypothetical protein